MPEGGLELFFLVEHFFEVLSDGAKNGTTLNFIHFSLEEKKTYMKSRSELREKQ